MSDLAELAGRAVAVPLGAVARFRRGRPMHPRGAVFDASVERHGAQPPFGVPWLDEVREDRVVVRLSRGAGLPAPLPDLLGLAIRFGGDEAPVDLLLSSTGRGTWTRLVPVPRVDAGSTYSSIMAYRSAAGPLRIAALPRVAGVGSDPEPVADAAADGALDFVLAAAVGLGGWRPFARLRSTSVRATLDPAIRFDAVRNPPPGLVADGPMARFREPSYATARVAGRTGR
ncbi:phosphodiesterase [Blastococcus sp. TF02A-35]|uniref:phosphodiesterase n=1 Tax=Blastococcus sp. TF02A-35 TaxID=2559612 RepID=UPI0010743BD9|nr:phosphodiesterase [Blastococcus sp. TF02A_35]TFV53419.1 phosphodiesterase [Blastococcus sp. TF02A_35]